MALFKKSNPLVSVCIPVYGTEDLLLNCLNSVAHQNVPDQIKNFIEVVVVDDCSPSDTAKKIIKSFSKNCPFPINFIRHQKNKGLVEARRTALYEAKGKFIFNLDSDDSIPENAILSLYKIAVETDADIVHGKANVLLSNANTSSIDKDDDIVARFLKDREAEVNNVYDGQLLNLPEENKILDGYFSGNHMGYLWGKLFLRDTYIKAFEHIPPIENTMCEDIIQYIWLCYEAKKYVSVSDVVYNYSVNTGISSRSKISDLKRWEMVCSTASVFTALYEQFENPDIHFTEKQKDYIRQSCINHLKNNLAQWEQAATPEIKDEAYNLLCEYWGDDFVKRIQNEMKKLKESSNN